MTVDTGCVETDLGRHAEGVGAAAKASEPCGWLCLRMQQPSRMGCKGRGSWGNPQIGGKHIGCHEGTASKDELHSNKQEGGTHPKGG